MKPIYCLLFCFIFSLFALKINAQIINVEDKRVRLADSISWKGYIDLGFNVFQYDKRLTVARVATQVEYLKKKHFVMLFGGYNLAHTEGGAQNFLNDGYLHLRYNYDLNPKWFVIEGFVQSQYNERLRIVSRNLAGFGGRVKLRPVLKQRFYIGVAVMNEANQFKDTPDVASQWRMSSYMSYNFTFKGGSRWLHTTYFQPVLTDFSVHRLSSEASWLLKISKKWHFRATANCAFDNDARIPTTVPDFVWTWTNALRYEF